MPPKGKKKFGETSFGAGGSFGSTQSRAIPYENPESNPLEDFEPTGDLEADSNAEMSAIHAAMLETRRKVDRQVKHAIDGAFYITVCFISADDRDAFLKATGMDHSVYRECFLDGYQLANQLGLDSPRRG